MIEWRPTLPSDVEQVTRHVRQSWKENYLTLEKLTERVMESSDVDLARTAWTRQPLCIVGITPLWPGVGEAWMLVSRHAAGHGFGLVKGVRRELARAVERAGLRRVQLTVDETDGEAVRFVLLLGAEFEGRMLEYGLNGSTYLMARLRP